MSVCISVECRCGVCLCVCGVHVGWVYVYGVVCAYGVCVCIVWGLWGVVKCMCIVDV